MSCNLELGVKTDYYGNFLQRLKPDGAVLKVSFLSLINAYETLSKYTEPSAPFTYALYTIVTTLFHR
jgi:hypothetical protein